MLFRFTKIWEKIIVIIMEKWTESIVINEEQAARNWSEADVVPPNQRSPWRSLSLRLCSCSKAC